MTTGLRCMHIYSFDDHYTFISYIHTVAVNISITYFKYQNYWLGKHEYLNSISLL